MAAILTSSAREFAFIFCMTCPRCAITVNSPMPSSPVGVTPTKYKDLLETQSIARSARFCLRAYEDGCITTRCPCFDRLIVVSPAHVALC